MAVTVRTILLVEDHDDDLFLMVRALRRAGIVSELVRVGDGADAIDYLAGRANYADRSAHPEPDVVFLDIRLPRKSGFEVLEWIQANRRFPPPVVLMLSSSNDAGEEARARALGALAYAVKPPTPQLFESLGSQFDLDWPRKSR